ncbi:MAG: hypothetical protein GWN00_38205 [Aliifodinibius sp.]|nr:hypothetical protein [Fodinibius sp.]NIY30411.1 hypothetical protein [Fodinibius sp.]
MKRCLRRGFDMMGVSGECEDLVEVRAKHWPVGIYAISQAGEFISDEDQEKFRTGRPTYHSTLGQLTQILWTRNYKNTQT